MDNVPRITKQEYKTYYLGDWSVKEPIMCGLCNVEVKEFKDYFLCNKCGEKVYK